MCWARQITRPVILGTDGHTSREDEAVLGFLRTAKIRQFLEPGQTSDALHPPPPPRPGPAHHVSSTASPIIAGISDVRLSP
jgi:hypothetical protein